MTITQVVTELEMEMEESQNQRDKRVEGLWRKLDPQGKGELDIKGLQTGLRRIDHPLQNADDMLREMIKVVDTNRDGKIQYEGRVQVPTTTERVSGQRSFADLSWLLLHRVPRLRRGC